MIDRQKGQAMVEYTIVVMALIAALLAPSIWLSSDTSGEGTIGLDQSQQGTLLRAVANKHRGYGYALSLAEIPETDGTDVKLKELAAYYDSLGKYPGLSAQLKQGANKLTQWNGQLNSLNKLLSQYVPPKPPDVCKELKKQTGSVAGYSLSPPGC